MKTRLSFFILVGFCCMLGLFISCSNEEPAPPIELKTICKEYGHDKVFLLLNGDTLSPSVDMSIHFSDGQLPEADTYASRMVLETVAPWIGADGNTRRGYDLKFDVDVSSSVEEVVFSGNEGNTFYSMEIEGLIRNDSVWLEMTYQSEYEVVKGKTFELQMSSDSYMLERLNENVKYQDTVVWNGVTYSTIDFVRESLGNIYKEYVEKTGIDAYRLTFREDGRMDMMARNAQTGDYTPMDGYFAYRFHKYNGGVFEVGMKEAVRFYTDFVDELGDLNFPNFLFKAFIRERAYMPVDLRSFYYTLNEDEYEERLFLELAGFLDGVEEERSFEYFLGEYTKWVNDLSDETKRLRKIKNLLYHKKIADEFLFYMKEVK